VRWGLPAPEKKRLPEERLRGMIETSSEMGTAGLAQPLPAEARQRSGRGGVGADLAPEAPNLGELGGGERRTCED
jgi:hypothetical protein